MSNSQLNNFVFGPIQAPTLKNRIANHVLEAILTGGLPPGTRIVETQLAKQMDVAQTSVREALQDLANQGFLTKRVNRDTLVRTLTVKDIEKLFRLRVELEGLAVELAHSNIMEKALEPLYSSVEQMRRAARVKNIPEFYRHDMMFHKQLGALADNEFLERVLVPLTVGPIAFVLTGSSALLEVNYLQVAEDHAEILECFKEKTPKLARAVMEAKLRGWYELQFGGVTNNQTTGLPLERDIRTQAETS